LWPGRGVDREGRVDRREEFRAVFPGKTRGEFLIRVAGEARGSFRWQLAGDETVQDRSEAVDIGPWTFRLTIVVLFDRRITGRNRSRLVTVPGDVLTRPGEMNQDGVALGRDADGIELQVEMLETGGVELLKGGQQRPQQLGQLCLIGRAAKSLEPDFQIARFVSRGDPVRGIVCLEDVGELLNRRMCARHQGTSFLQKTFARPGEILLVPSGFALN
jgi:hypothetical protein